MAEAENIETDAFGVPPRPDNVRTAYNQTESSSIVTSLALPITAEEKVEQAETQRTSTDNTDESNSDATSVLEDIPPLHDTWTFNALLLQISDSLNSEEFDKMKFMYKGLIGSGTLKRLKSPGDLFDIMTKRVLLSPVNLLQLCGLLKSVNRLDLVHQVADYGMKTEKALYLSPASLVPVNGYTHVKFHVKGRNFTRTTRLELNNFRNMVAAMLAISPQFVLIDGINPSSSVTITLLIPDTHAKVLQNMLESKDDYVEVELICAGVDRVTIGDKSFVLQDTDSTKEPDKKYMEDIDLFKRCQSASQSLENTELENVKLKEQLKQMKKDLMKLQAENDVWRFSAKPKGLFEETVTPERSSYKGSLNTGKAKQKDESDKGSQENMQKALEDFSKSVTELANENCNKEKILKLLESHCILIAARCYHELSSIIWKLVTQMGNLFHGLVSNVTIAEVKRLMGDEPVEQKALRKISAKITAEEKCVLEKAYDLNEQDKQVLETGLLPILSVLYKKECEVTEEVNIIEFLRKCLSMINRVDLLNMFVQEVRELSAEKKQKQPETKVNRKEFEKGRDFSMESIAMNVNVLVEKVDKIDRKLSVLHEVPSLQNFTNTKTDYANLLRSTFI